MCPAGYDGLWKLKQVAVWTRPEPLKIQDCASTRMAPLVQFGGVPSVPARAATGKAMRATDRRPTSLTSLSMGLPFICVNDSEAMPDAHQHAAHRLGEVAHSLEQSLALASICR